MLITLSDGDSVTGEPPSYIGYFPKILDSSLKTTIKTYCDNLDEFRGGMSSFGKPIPRLQRWYQKDNHYFSPNWKTRYDRWNSFQYDKTLIDIQTEINQITNKLLEGYSEFIEPMYNSCLINYYRDECDSIKPHSDSIDVFGNTPTISIVSIGESRDIYFKRRDMNRKLDKSLKLEKKFGHLNSKITLEHGSLLIMAGYTQKYYIHEIPPDTEKKKARFSLTFREYIL